jgi:hypothetical protein
MSLIDTAKTAYDLAKKGMTVELQEKIMQLREEALELQEENQRLRKENGELKERMELQETVHFRRKVYWRDGDEIPFCPYCREASDILIHLTFFGSRDRTILVYLCPECGSKYAVEEDGDFCLSSGRTNKSK